jgi:hypothetical protein
VAEFRLALQSLGGEKAWRGAFDEAYGDIAKAAQFTIEEAADIGKRRARSSIASAGFSVKWQNALRAEVYPKRPKYSVNAAAFFFHTIGYAGIFDYGVSGNTITGSPLLWIPLPGIPKQVGGRRTRPSLWRGKLYLVKPPRVKHPTLFGMVGKAYRPIFIGLDEVSLRKRFRVVDTLETLRVELPALFVKHLSVLDGK